MPAHKFAKQYKFAKDQVGQSIDVQKITPRGEGQ
jgi:hypothetical protein